MVTLRHLLTQNYLTFRERWIQTDPHQNSDKFIKLWLTRSAKRSVIELRHGSSWADHVRSLGDDSRGFWPRRKMQCCECCNQRGDTGGLLDRSDKLLRNFQCDNPRAAAGERVRNLWCFHVSNACFSWLIVTNWRARYSVSTVAGLFASPVLKKCRIG